MILTLAWKEYCEQRTIWLLLLAVCLAALYAVIQIFGLAVTNLSPDVFLVVEVLLLSTAGIYGVVCGALLLAGEDEAGMRPFLHRHAGWRSRLWFGKLLIGILFSAAFGLALAGGLHLLGPPLGKEPALWYLVLPAATVAACAWGLVGGALLSDTMAAAVVAAVFGFPLVFSGMTAPNLGEALLIYGLSLLFPLSLSLLIYCGTDLRRLMSGGRAERLLRANRTPGGWLSLFWLTYQQTRWPMAVFAALGLAVGVALPWVGIAGWAAYSLLLGVTLGVGVFAGDQPNGRVFLGERRVPPHRVWLAKMLFAVAFLAAMTALLTGMAAIHDELQRTMRGSAPPDLITESFAPRVHSILSNGVGPTVFAAYWLAYGFGIGQLLSFLFRKGLVALVLALLLACLVPLVWVPSIIAGGVHGWQLFLPLAPLFLATGLTTRAWLGDRLATRGPALAVVGCVFLTVLLTAGAVVYRVTEIPDVGPPFDVDAYRSQLSRERTGKLEIAMKEAIDDYKSFREKVGGRDWVVPDRQEKSAHQVAEEQLGAVTFEGAPRVGKELSHHLDEMFLGKWVESLREALRLPPEMLESPNTLGWVPRVEVWTLYDMGRLLRARVLQLQNRGDQEGALRAIQDLFRLSLALGYRASLEGYGSGQRVAGLALDGVSAWLDQERPPPAKAVRSLLTFLAEEERRRPSLREAIKVEELVEKNLLNEPGYIRVLFDPGSLEDGRHKVDQSLAFAAVQIPWEKERLRRRVNQFSARLFGALEMPFPIERVRRPEANTDEERRAALRADIEQNGTRSEIQTARRLDFSDKEALCRLRAARIQAALVLYQLEQGKNAPSLDALVPRYFDALPKDPYGGQDFRYRVSKGEGITKDGGVPQGPGGRLGWYVWFAAGAEGEPGAPGGPVPEGGGAVGGPGGPGPVPLYFDFAVGTAGFVGLWAGPPGLNFLTPAWMLAGLDLGHDTVQYVRPGQGVLWSVGPDGRDDGGRRIARLSPFQSNDGIDLVFIVPDFIGR